MANKNTRSGGKKWTAFWVGFIAFIIVAAILAGLMGWRTSGFKDWTFGFGIEASKPDDTPNDKDPANPDKPNDGNTTVTPEPEKTAGFSLMSARISPEDYEAYGIAEEAESANKITLNLTPEHGKFDSIEYSLEFENPNSEWLSITFSQNVWDYVNIQTLDGVPIHSNSYQTMTDKSIYLIRQAAFGEAIILTVKVTANSNEYIQTCRLECVATIDNVFDGNSELVMDSLKDGTLKLNLQWGVGSIKPNIVKNGGLSVRLDDSICQSLSTNYNYQFKNEGKVDYSGNELLAEDFEFGLDLERLLDGEYNETQFWNDFYDVVNMVPDMATYSILTVVFDCEIYCDAIKIGNYYTSVNVRINGFEDLVTWVTGFELSTDTIIFN